MNHKTSLAILGATLAWANAQGEGQGYPPPPPQTLESTKSGVLVRLPTSSAAFEGLEINEGAIVHDAMPNPTFTPLNGPATTQTNLPAATYQAMLPPTNYDNGLGSTLTGNVMISSSPSAPGVNVMVTFHGLPSQSLYGPLVYHIHTLAVPANGNCSATMGHLDPTNRGESPACDPTRPDLCQVGDLSGKHGNITTEGDFTAQYTDPFLSTDPSSMSFFGDKSIVIHTSNATRITCANFMMMGANGTMAGGAAPSGTGMGGYPSGTMSGMPVQQTGNVAASLVVGGAAVMGAVLGMLV